MTLLVIDIGSSSVRALLFDSARRLIPNALASQTYQINTTPAGAAFFDMSALQAAVESCIDSILTHPQANTIRIVGVDTLVGNLVGVDAAGQPVTPVYLYADTRAAADAEVLGKIADAEAIHQRTGCVLHSAYHPARLHWLRRTQPEEYERVTRWLDVGSYLYQQWFGRAVTSYSVASWSGLLDKTGLTWDREWLRLLGLTEDQLAELTDYDHFQQGLTEPYARRWQPLRAVPFALPVGDGAAANIGSGCVDEHSIALTVGTTAALRLVSQSAVSPLPAGLWAYRVDALHHLVGGATSEGGNIFRWAKTTLALDLDDAALDAALAARSADEHGLTILPLLAGERSPGWAADASGAIIGLTLATTPLDILQAALEAVALRLSLLADQLLPLAQPPIQLIASGGALAASPAWAQMIASALGLPLHITVETELTARGTAILAASALDKTALHAFPPTSHRVIDPQPHQARLLRLARERQQALYQQIIAHPIKRSSMF
jgi:gluconokinase